MIDINNYNKGYEFVSKRVIVALSKEYTYYNNPLDFVKSPIFDNIQIEKIELLLHVKPSSGIGYGPPYENRVGAIILIYLVNQEKQAVLDTIDALRADPYVVYAEPDYFMELDFIPNDQFFDSLWGMKKISVPNAWDKFTGCCDIVVGVVDSGINYNHADLRDNMYGYGWDFYNDNYDFMDENGHGTHVAGTVGAVGNNYIGIAGVNWNVKMSSLKIGGASSSVCVSAAIKATVFATERGMPILNNSWGGGAYNESLKIAIQQYDGLFIAAAGNSGIDNDSFPHYPASYDCDNIITVAATNQNDALASFSNYGATTVDIAAPGVDIYSAFLDGGYGYNNGTSMAAPHVAGAAALLKGYRPDLTALELKYIILSSADKINGLYGKVLTSGRLNANAMLEMAAALQR